MKALVSIHDLMPETMDRVEQLLKWLNARGVPPVTLLVVPGKPWSSRQLARLRELSAGGHPLAAHGWQHQTRPRRMYHRLHAALLSRNVAEHLDLDSRGILDLLLRAQQWFPDNGLPEPDFYVPPAWALGPIQKADLAAVPFRIIETTTGIRFPSGSQKQRTLRLPLTGYEADTAVREKFLRVWNRRQMKRAQRSGRPLRISIHPDDLQLRVADQLQSQIEAVDSFIDYAALQPPQA
ncbi:polysaccharide deacetylase family protein [Coraliomargarita parva]|uniref:polysaccharide deacetylase family protein n=1 Tax=Coraliomargarita parva TaxID=3014050 RepID=UPI0022B400B7|nr:polysaccharide deacetylase family protein [Coraliomargarita parva]